MSQEEIESTELRLLLEAVYAVSGYDFRQYAEKTVRRRVQGMIRLKGLASVSALQDKILHEPEYLSFFLEKISVPTTSMFRNPTFYTELKEKVLPVLQERELIRVWSAGCSTGEEAYSLAILFTEAGLYERTRIYATDVSEFLLDRARQAMFPIRVMRDYTSNYQKAGGKSDFSNYYSTGYGSAILDSSLKSNLTFGQHNLVCDASFNEFHLIVCRNVLIYFQPQLQRRVHQLFHESLADKGVLALGRSESIIGGGLGDLYRVFSPKEKIYLKIK